MIATATPGARVVHWRVYQAQGMVSVQCDCALDCALVRLERRADRDGVRLEALARAVVERRLRLD